MTSERDATRIVRSWLQTDEHESAERVLGTVLGRLDTTPQHRPLRRARRPHSINGTFKFAAAAMAAVLVAGAGSAIYLSRPAVVPVGSPSPTASASPQSTASASPLGAVAYSAYLRDTGTRRLWVVNKDGTDAHELLPDVPGDQDIRGWSRDGTQIFFEEVASGDLYRTGPAGSPPELVCKWDERDCPWRGTLSPDGTRVAFAINDEGDGGTSTIAILEVSTGQVTVLESTRVPRSGTQCESPEHSGVYPRPPSWSPDGTQIAFSRMFAFESSDVTSPSCRRSVIFVANADGSGLRQLTRDDMVAYDPKWSPDGETIAFGGDERKPTERLWATDLYTIRRDGSDMRALTTDAGPDLGHWTKGGRIVYRHTVPAGGFGEVRVVDQDGGNTTQVDATDIVALTAVGCLICPYAGTGAVSGNWPADAYWQP